MAIPPPYPIHTQPKTWDIKHSAGKSSFIRGQCPGQADGRRQAPDLVPGRGPAGMMDKTGGG